MTQVAPAGKGYAVSCTCGWSTWAATPAKSIAAVELHEFERVQGTLFDPWALVGRGGR